MPLTSAEYDRLRTVQEANLDKFAHDLANEVFAEHLFAISGDGTGSHPEDYLSVRDAEACREFIDDRRLRHHGDFPNTESISLKQRRLNRFVEAPVWRKTGHYPPHPLSKLVFLGTTDRWEGYRIGVLDLDSDRPIVMLCTDGLLRCFRSPQTFRHSNGMGYGTLPRAIEFNEVEDTLTDYVDRNGGIDGDIWDRVESRFNDSESHRVRVALSKPNQPLAITLSEFVAAKPRP